VLAPASAKRTFYPLTISAIRPLTRDAIEVSFAVPEALRAVYCFAPGQFLTLEATVDGNRVRRSYSICVPPSSGELRVAIKRVHDGAFSRFAHETLKPGVEVLVGPPEGRFGIPHDPSFAKQYLAFAAGSGITPVISIVRHVLETEPQSGFTLVYGNRSSSSVMFRDELQALKDRYLGRFSIAFVMSREAQDLDLFSGRIDRAKCDALLEAWIDPSAVDAAFVCGPQAMTEAVLASLEAHGVAKDRMRTELFAAAPRPSATSGVATRSPEASDGERAIEATAVFEGRRHTFTIERGKETVLAAGLRAGIDLPFSCRGGVCSTCRAVLVRGEVDMDIHYALEDYEVARGLILMCQSYPVTDSVAIDVDAAAHG
jgi:ring-1,2-phenylacetyl-CoA epoxidase subunit PaaE